MNLVIKTKSNLWHFLKAIQVEHLAKEVELKLILQGNVIKPRRSIQKKKETILKNLKDLYAQGVLSALQYNNNLSFRML